MIAAGYDLSSSLLPFRVQFSIVLGSHLFLLLSLISGYNLRGC